MHNYIRNIHTYKNDLSYLSTHRFKCAINYKNCEKNRDTIKNFQRNKKKRRKPTKLLYLNLFLLFAKRDTNRKCDFLTWPNPGKTLESVICRDNDHFVRNNNSTGDGNEIGRANTPETPNFNYIRLFI